jgi:hypothetical protein
MLHTRVYGLDWVWWSMLNDSLNLSLQKWNYLDLSPTIYMCIVLYLIGNTNCYLCVKPVQLQLSPSLNNYLAKLAENKKY